MTNEQIALKIQEGRVDFCADLWDNVENYVYQAQGDARKSTLPAVTSQVG